MNRVQEETFLKLVRQCYWNVLPKYSVVSVEHDIKPLWKKPTVFSIFKAKWVNNENPAILVTMSYPSVSYNTSKPLEALNTNRRTEWIRKQRGHTGRGMEHWLHRGLQGICGYRHKNLKLYKMFSTWEWVKGKKAKRGSRGFLHVAFTSWKAERCLS